MTRIIHMETLKPKFSYTTDEIVEAACNSWLLKADELTRRKALKIFKGSQIDVRNAVVPLDIAFGELSFEQKNNIYKEEMVKYGVELLSNAISSSGIDPKEIDYIITTSCTGFMIPSVDAYLVNELGLRKDVVRLPVTEMGCAGGTAGLIYANDFLKANPDKTAVLLTMEIPSITFQRDDFSAENLVSTAIFSDGFACAILKGGEGRGAHIVDTDMYHFHGGTHLMGFNLVNSGLKIVLDKEVPNAIEGHFESIFLPFLKRNGLQIDDIQHYMFHPGGKKIINMVQDYISDYGKDISESKWVLNNHGNMSSATILHIFDRVNTARDIKTGDMGYMLAFGPGFMAQSLILKWENE
ncbi:type III polyketide synthase [Halobacteriovorax sp. HLS]|uniref:type III polyketide synthase n=1 Tax=Halobacteriovorax sp. HLS TaxID=2234000 RepID=UPI0019D4DE6B|nr:type III polyketide synthase [Halobacteriovorax sp. HLS]